MRSFIRLFFSLSIGISILSIFTTSAAAQNSNSPFQARPIESLLRIPFEQQRVIVGAAIRVPAEHYLYADKTDLQIEAPAGVTVGDLQKPPTVIKHDPYLKKNLSIYPAAANGKDELVLTREIILPSRANMQDKLTPVDHVLKMSVRYQGCNPKVCYMPTTQEWQITIRQSVDAPPPAAIEKNPTTASWWDFNRHAKSSFALLLLLAFIGGLISSLTPCVYPMIPITIAVIGAKQAGSKLQSLKLGGVFALGLAMTYAVMGVIAATSGGMLGAALQNRWLVVGIASVFIVMGLSMFGLLEFRLPYRVNQWIARSEGKGGLLGVGITGMITGLVAAPCVGPVVVGILGYVATQGKPFLGFSLLFVFALGLSTLFVVLGVFTSLLTRLPKSGVWMEKVKRFLGIVMIGVGLYYLAPLLKPLLQSPQMNRHQGTGIQWQDDLDKALAQAKQEGRPVMVDFYADWCLACKELDAYTYSDAQVVAVAKGFINVKLDFTQGDAKKQQILERYKILGLPSIHFFDAKGEWLPNERIDGFIPAKTMLAKLQRLTNKT